MLSSFLAPTLLYLTRQLSIMWRERLSKRMWKVAFKPKVYYKGSQVYKDAQDIDQRMTDDLDRVMLLELFYVLSNMVSALFRIGKQLPSSG